MAKFTREEIEAKVAAGESLYEYGAATIDA
jgi:hypothetical protein